MAATPSTVQNAAQATSVKDKYVLPMTMQVPWDPQFQLGFGYNYLEEASVGAVIPATDVNRPGTATSKIEYQYVSSQEDLNRLVAASVGASGTVEGVKVKTDLEFTKSVRFSETSETFIFSWYSDCTNFDRIKSPALDGDAVALSRSDPHSFRLNYGDYFVSGGLQRSEFHAVYQMSALKKQDLVSFKASVEASLPEVLTAKGSTEFMQAASKNRVTISATVFHTAAGSTLGLGNSASMTPDQVVAMFNDFRQTHRDSWAVAELTHYSKIAPHLVREIPVPPSFAVDRALLRAAQIAYRGILDGGALPRDLAKSLRTRRNALDSTVSARAALYWDDPAALAEDRAEAEALANDARAAADFLRRIRVLAGKDGGYANIVGRRGGEAGLGTHGDQTVVPDGVQLREDSFDLRGDFELAASITRSQDKSYPGMIVYIKARNNWPEATGGKLNSFTGGIGQSNLHIGCTADLSRGLSWTIFVKYVETE